MIATATTTKTIASLRASGFEVTERPAYGQTVEFWCYRNVGDVSGWRGCVLVVSKRAGRLVRASKWTGRERELRVRGTATEIAREIRAHAA